MELEQAVLGRRSIRAFRPDPVPLAVLRELVDVARWTPSGLNTQPWEFTVVGGDVLQKLRSRLRETAAVDPVGKPEIGQPTNLSERFKARRLALGNATLQALGIAPEDKVKKDEYFLRNISFFDAPHVIVLTMERCFTEREAMEMGAVAVTLMLLAHGRGLGTCPQWAPLRYAWIFHEVLGIPGTKRVMLAIPIGYPNLDAPVNRYTRTRVSPDELLRWLGVS